MSNVIDHEMCFDPELARGLSDTFHGFFDEDVDHLNDAFASQPASPLPYQFGLATDAHFAFAQHVLEPLSQEHDRASPSLPAVTGSLDNQNYEGDSVIGEPHPRVQDDEQSQASKRPRFGNPCTSEAHGGGDAAPPPPPPPPPPAPTAAIATNPANQAAFIAAWSAFVDEAWVKGFVDALQHATKGDAASVEFARILVEEFGVLNKGDGQVLKLVLIDRALLAMSRTLCQDPRCTDLTRTIIEVDLLPGEELGGVQRMLRPGRCFTVHDPLAFNCILRALQSKWSAAAHGTKSVTEMLDIVGIGPLKSSRGRGGVFGNHRGPADTDPNKFFPKGRDGLYLRRYEFDQARVAQARTVVKAGRAGGGCA